MFTDENSVQEFCSVVKTSDVVRNSYPDKLLYSVYLVFRDNIPLLLSFSNCF